MDIGSMHKQQRSINQSNSIPDFGLPKGVNGYLKLSNMFNVLHLHPLRACLVKGGSEEVNK